MNKKPILSLSCKVTLLAVFASATVVSAFQTTSAADQTDTISVTIESNCVLSYGSTAHTDGDGVWGTETTANTLSATRSNGSATSSLGSTSFSVTCNDGGGSQVALTTTSLTSENSDTIEFDDAEPSSEASSWGVYDGTSWLASGDNVWSSEGSVAGSTFSVTYGVGIDSTQSAGTYTGTATYTLSHPYSPPTPPVTTKYMQDVATWSSTLTAEEQIQVVDKRDDKTYWVAKLADGNIWMTQNLDFDIDSSKTYTSADTNVSSDWKPSTSTYATGSTTWESSDATPESYDPGDLCWKGNLNEDYDGTLSTEATTCATDNTNYHIGNYYNWTAAVAMNDSSSYTTEGATATQSICPAGWTLPLGGYEETGSGSFYYLLDKYGYNYDWGEMTGSYKIWSSPLNFVIGGSWIGSSGVVASYGAYWSSVVVDSEYSNSLYSHSDGRVDPQGLEYRSTGFSVRCVAI